MSSIQESIDLEVPVRTAYNQWTQFEEFPRFMEGLESVTQIDDKNLHWVASIGGQKREWDAEITEQLPDERIAWNSTTGTPNGGVVTFHYLDENRCRVMLQIDYTPEDFLEKVGDVLGVVTRRVQGDLQRFKDFIEGRGVETGAWRGEIDQDKVGKKFNEPATTGTVGTGTVGTGTGGTATTAGAGLRGGWTAPGVTPGADTGNTGGAGDNYAG